MVDDVDLTVNQSCGLVLDGLDDSRVGVPGVDHRNPAGKVKVPPTSSIIEVGSLTVIYADVDHVAPDGRKVLLQVVRHSFAPSSILACIKVRKTLFVLWPFRYDFECFPGTALENPVI
jgi:hypothetical protein